MIALLLPFLLAAPPPPPPPPTLDTAIPFVSRFPAIPDTVPLPDENDRFRFPSQEVAERQFQLCLHHKGYLELLRSINGHSGGSYDAWIAEMDFRLVYWQRLTWAWRFVEDAGDWRERQLRVLQQLIGLSDYQGGWRPELLSDQLHPKPMPVACDNP